MFKKLYYTFLNLGIDDTISSEDRLTIEFVNTISLLILVFSLLGSSQLFVTLNDDSLIFSQYSHILLALICAVSAVLSLYFSSKKNLEYAKLTLFFSIYIVVIGANVLFDITSGEFIYFLFLPILIYYLFGATKKVYIILFVTLLTIALVTLYKYNFGALIKRPEEMQFYILLTNIGIALLAMTALVHYQVKTNLKIYNIIDSQASTDLLAGLANRLGLKHYMHATLNMVKREQSSLALVMFDIDYFKQYNDRYGHLKGDDCLKQVSIFFKEMVPRDTDIVSRYGGEEFVVVLYNPTYDFTMHLSEKIRQEVEALQIAHGNSPISEYITISGGVFWMDSNGSDVSLDDLIAKADEALYKAKESGRNKVCSVVE